MSVMVIDEAISARITAVKAYARRHPFHLAELRARASGAMVFNPVGDDERHVVHIPVGYKACLSVEEQPEPLGWGWHVSISLNRTGKVANVVATAWLMDMMGLPSGPGDWENVYVEQIGAGYLATSLFIPFKKEPHG